MLVPDEIVYGYLAWASLFCAVTPIRYVIVDTFQNGAERYSFSRGFGNAYYRFLALMARVGANSFRGM